MSTSLNQHFTPWALLKFAFPSIIMMIFMSLYTIVDGIYISRFLGSNALSSLNIVFPVINVVIAIATMLGTGGNAIISKYLGEGKNQEARECLTSFTVIGLAVSILLLILTQVFLIPICRILGSTDILLADCQAYLSTSLMFAPACMLQTLFQSYLVTAGMPALGLFLTIGAGILNAVLDYVLILVFPMGITGAALATGIGQALSTGVYLVVYASTELPVRLRRACLKLDKELDTRLYSIGIPAILNLALPSLLVTFLNSLLAAFSGSYVVVLGIYYKLQTFLYLPANGIVQGMRPLIGYNYGAGEHKRVRQLYQITLILSAAIMAAGTLGCLGASEPLMRLFTSTPETVEAGKIALRIICLGFVVSAISTTSSGALEGLGKGTQSLVISLCRYIVFIMPLAWVLCRQFGPVGVWNAFWATEVLSAIVSLIVYKKSV